MPDTTNEKLRILSKNARAELSGAGDSYGALISQLEILERSLESDDLNAEVLESARNAFPAKFLPMRAALPAGEGLKETRRLWEEINHIVKSRQEKRP